MTKITINERDSGQRLDKYLRKYLEKSTSGFLYKMLRKKNITLNGGKAAGSEMLRPGDEVTLFLSDETILKFGGVIPRGIGDGASAEKPSICPQKESGYMQGKTHQEENRHMQGKPHQEENGHMQGKPHQEENRHMQGKTHQAENRHMQEKTHQAENGHMQEKTHQAENGHMQGKTHQAENGHSQGKLNREKNGHIQEALHREELRREKRYRQYEEAYEAYSGLEIVFENEHILVANKPVGMLTQKAAPEDLSLNEWLIGYLLKEGKISKEELHTFKPSVCNRLDRNTSGLVLCGKTLAGSQQISALLKNRSLRKFYCLYVKGTVTESSQIEGYLKKDRQTNRVEICKDADVLDASYIKTAYKPLKNYRNMTMLEAELITGKTHQIRIHLASIGHPVLGDYKYGYFEFNDRYKKKYGIDKQLLHASRLEFPKMEGKWADLSELVLTAKLPEIFRVLDEGEK